MEPRSLPSDSPNYFNPIPEIYDSVMGPLYFEVYAQEMATRVASWHPLSVLETACGTGIVTAHLRKDLDDQAKLTATDINGEMLDFAKKKLARHKNITWLEANAMELPFPGESYDVVICQFGAMFFTDKQKGFSEAFRVLKPAGKYAVSVWDRLDVNPLGAVGRDALVDFFNGRPPERLRTAFSLADISLVSDFLSKAGFRNIRAEVLNKPSETESAEKFAEAFLYGSSIRETIGKHTPAAVAELQERIANSIIRKFGNHPVRSTMQAIFFTASRD